MYSAHFTDQFLFYQFHQLIFLISLKGTTNEWKNKNVSQQ